MGDLVTGTEATGEPYLAVRVLLLPKDTNGNGTIFGGVILSHLDLAGAVECRRHAHARFATVAMDQVVFREPVFVGDLISFWTRLVRIGRTSITVDVAVEARRHAAFERPIEVTRARVTYVALDAQGHKAAIERLVPPVG